MHPASGDVRQEFESVGIPKTLAWDSCRVQRMVLPHTSMLIRFPSGAVVRLADHGWVTIGGSVLLRGVQVGVHDTVGAVGSIRKGPGGTWWNWPPTWSASPGAPDRPAGPVATARRTILMLAPCGLGLEVSSASRTLTKRIVSCCGEGRMIWGALHKSHLAILR